MIKFGAALNHFLSDVFVAVVVHVINKNTFKGGAYWKEGANRIITVLMSGIG